MTTNEPSEAFSPEEMTARNGADVFYRDAAKDAVEAMRSDMSLTTVINDYCIDPQFAMQQVEAFVTNLPTNQEKIMRSFILYELLHSTRQELAELVGQDLRELEEAARGRQDKAVDDDAIRESAGYSDQIDEDVAESHKTDKAQELNIDDQDVADSATEDVTYQDQTAINSPLLTFMQATRTLADDIVQHCLQNDDVMLLHRAELTDISPRQLAMDIKGLAARLQPPRDEDK